MRDGSDRRSVGVTTLGDLALTGKSRILVDTTVVVDALLATQRAHQPCDALLRAILRADATLVFSRLLEIELPQAASYIAGFEATGDRRSGLRDGRVRRRTARIARSIRDQWEVYLSTVRWTCVELDAVAARVTDVMVKSGLRSYDAAIAASAVDAECDAIATLDGDFGRIAVRDIPMIATVAAKIPRVRRLRAAARPI